MTRSEGWYDRFDRYLTLHENRGCCSPRSLAYALFWALVMIGATVGVVFLVRLVIRSLI